MKLLAPTCLLVGYLLCAVENLALERTFGQSPKFNRAALESRPVSRRPGLRSFNRAAVESFPSLGLSRRVPLRDAVEGRPPLDSIPPELQIRDRPLINSNLIPVAAGPNPFLFVPPAPPLNFFKIKINEAGSLVVELPSGCTLNFDTTKFELIRRWFGAVFELGYTARNTRLFQVPDVPARWMEGPEVSTHVALERQDEQLRLAKIRQMFRQRRGIDWFAHLPTHRPAHHRR